MSEPKPKASVPQESLKIRGFSDVVYLYPAWIASIVCGLWVATSAADPSAPGQSGLVFTLVFFVNLTVIAFDYTRLTSVVVLMLAVIIGLLSAIYPVVGETLRAVFDQPLFMNSTFYMVWAVLLGLILAGLVLKTRFDYWELKNQELLHHHGILGDVERWPAPNMRISKEIGDVLEFALLRSGRLVLVPRGEARAIVIDNVPRINVIEREMQRILGTLRVSDDD